MNESKTEFIYFVSINQLGKCSHQEIDVNGKKIERARSTRYLGFHLDESLDMKQHIKVKCRAAMANLIRIRVMRKYPTRSTTEQLVIALVISHLDYGNILLDGLQKTTTRPLE